MKIGYLIGSLLTGGSERQLCELSGAMVARGHDVQVMAYDGPGPFDCVARDRGVVVRHSAGGSKRAKIKRIREWAREFRPDVVHGFMKRASSLAVLGNLPMRRYRVVASDFSTATYSRGQPVLWAALVLFAMADRVVTQTETNRRSIAMLAPFLRSKTLIIRNGVDTARFRVSEAPSENGVFRFLSVGTVYRLKNPVLVVDAAKALRDRGFEFTLDWVGHHGQGGRESDDYRAAVRRVRESGLGDTVRFPGPSNRMEETYGKYHALVHVSLQDGIPNALVEGMACGLPVVVSSVSDLPRIVAEGDNGFTCCETDPESIADAMQRMIESSATLRKRMSEGSHELAVRWFGLDRFGREYDELYRSIVGDVHRSGEARDELG